jgi:hypothetical protein
MIMSETELSAAQARIADLELSQVLLKRELDDARKRADDGFTKYAEMARQHAEMMNLYVAAHRLHESLDRKDVLAAIQEIVINLIGSEELAVFELADDGARLKLVDSFGIEQEQWKEMPLARGPLEEAIKEGRTFISEGGGGSGRLTACVPLMAGEKAVGLVAVFSLLPHKPQIETNDRELFDVLRSHGGSALFCTRLAATEAK